MTREVILLFGGESRERLVSVATAKNLFKVLGNPTCWFWDVDDKVYVVSAAELDAHTDPFRTPFSPKGLVKFSNLQNALDTAHEAIIFSAIHGGRGEDGTVQKWLEERHIQFTGSGSRACRLAFDKVSGKNVMKEFGVRVADSIVIKGSNSESELQQFFASHPKIAVKPVADGSSFGLLIIDDEKQLPTAIRQFEESPQTAYLVEAFIEGTELTVGVIDDVNGPRALPCTEIRTKKGQSFDYNEKYLKVGAEITPAEIPESMARAAQRVALAVHCAFGCEGYSRTDLIVDKNGPVFLELNTLPGLTAASLVPQQLAACGMTLRAFCDLQIRLAERS